MINDLKDFGDAIVIFINFILITYVPEIHHLKECCQQICAIILSVIILVLTRISEDRYFYIFIQVKNYESSNLSVDKNYSEFSKCSNLTSECKEDIVNELKSQHLSVVNDKSTFQIAKDKAFKLYYKVEDVF